MEKLLALQEIRGRLEELHKIVVQLIIDDMPKMRKSEEVVATILKYAGLKMNKLTDSRKKEVIFYKRIMCYILYDYCHLTMEETAATIKLKNHGTIKHHSDKMRWWMSNPQYAPGDIITATTNILKGLGYEKN